jgi:hypothetical protein
MIPSESTARRRAVRRYTSICRRVAGAGGRRTRVRLSAVPRTDTEAGPGPTAALAVTVRVRRPRVRLVFGLGIHPCFLSRSQCLRAQAGCIRVTVLSPPSLLRVRVHRPSHRASAQASTEHTVTARPPAPGPVTVPGLHCHRSAAAAATPGPGPPGPPGPAGPERERPRLTVVLAYCDRDRHWLAGDAGGDRDRDSG